MKVSLYKILAVKSALESLNLMAIPETEENDIESLIAIIIVGLADRPDQFNTFISTIADETKMWSEDIDSSVAIMKDFFSLIPHQLNVLMNQLKSVSSTLENAVMKMMREEMALDQILESQEKE